MTANAQGPSGAPDAVIDMGSNSFRLVVYRYAPGRWFRLVDEIREPVRLSEGTVDGNITPAALARAGRAARLYAAYCDAAGSTPSMWSRRRPYATPPTSATSSRC